MLVFNSIHVQLKNCEQIGQICFVQYLLISLLAVNSALCSPARGQTPRWLYTVNTVKLLVASKNLLETEANVCCFFDFHLFSPITPRWITQHGVLPEKFVFAGLSLPCKEIYIKKKLIQPWPTLDSTLRKMTQHGVEFSKLKLLNISAKTKLFAKLL